MRDDVSAAVARLVGEHGHVTSGMLASALQVTRQTAQTHLNRAVSDGELVRTGAGRGVRYVLAGFRRRHPMAQLDEERGRDEIERALPQAGWTSEVTTGTRVTFVLGPKSTAPLVDVVQRFTRDLAFDKTRVRIKLLDFGDALISRSQAKRVVARLEQFRDVELDFRGVAGVGQGFVDEVFRVWAKAHPETTLVPTGMNDAVGFMEERGMRAGA